MKSRNCADKQVRDHWRPSPTNPCKNAQNFCLLTTTIPPRCTRHVGKDTIIEYGNDTIIPSFSPFLPSFSFLSFLFFLFFFFPTEFYLPKRKQQFTYRVILRFSMQTECKEKWYAARRILSGLRRSATTTRDEARRRPSTPLIDQQISFESDRVMVWPYQTLEWRHVCQQHSTPPFVATPHRSRDFNLASN